MWKYSKYNGNVALSGKSQRQPNQFNTYFFSPLNKNSFALGSKYLTILAKTLFCFFFLSPFSHKDLVTALLGILFPKLPSYLENIESGGLITKSSLWRRWTEANTEILQEKSVCQILKTSHLTSYSLWDTSTWANWGCMDIVFF